MTSFVFRRVPFSWVNTGYVTLNILICVKTLETRSDVHEITTLKLIMHCIATTFMTYIWECSDSVVEGLTRDRASTMSQRCVFEQNTLILA